MLFGSLTSASLLNRALSSAAHSCANRGTSSYRNRFYSKHLEGEKGSAFLELGLVMPLLITFMLVGTVEVGHLINEYQKLTQVAREGVRLASRLPALEDGILEFTAPTSAGGKSDFSFEDEFGNVIQASYPGSSVVLPVGQESVTARTLQLLHLTFRGNPDPVDLRYSLEPQWARQYTISTRMTQQDCVVYTNANLPCNPNTQGTVEVSISMTHQPFLFPDFVGLIPISVRRTGPYLYPNA